MSNTPDVKVVVSGVDDGVTTLLKTLSKQLAQTQADQKKLAASTNEANAAQSAFAKAGSQVLTHLKALATAYATLEVVHFVKDQLDAADAISKLAEKSGASTEALSVLAFAGETADVSLDQLTTSMARLAKSLTALQQNDRATVDAFKAIGISAADLKGLSVDDAFKKIANAMGGFGDSSDKATVAMQIFGKSGAEIIPLLNAMSHGGFDEATKEAQKFGKFLTADAAKAAEQFNDQLRLLKAEAEGIALSFGQELIPAVSDFIGALKNLKGEGDETFAKSLGSGAATVLRFTEEVGIAVFKTLGEALGDLATVGTAAWFAIGAAAKGSFAEAKQHVANAVQAVGELQDLPGLAVKNFNETRDALDKAEKDRDAKTTADRQKREQTEGKRVVLVNSQQIAEIAKARAAAEEQARADEGKILAANLAIRDQEAQHAFDNGLTSLSTYFAERKKTIEQSGAQEVAALKASRAALAAVPALTQADQIKKDSELKQKDADIEAAQLNTRKALTGVDIEREVLARQLAQTVLDAEAKMQEARGQTSAVAKAKLDEDVRNYQIALGKIDGLSESEKAKRVNDFRFTLTLDVDAKGNQEKINQLFGEIDSKRKELDDKVSRGVISQADAQKELAGFEQERLPTMKALADEAERLALALGNPQLIQAAQDLKTQLAGMGTVVKESTRLAAEFTSNVLDAAKGDLSDFLGTTISQTHSLGEAFASLATSIVSSIQRIVAQLIATKIIESLASLLAFGGGGGSAIAVPGQGSVNAGIAAGVKGFAGGGYTGAGGKYEPAGVVHRGEFVFPQEAVKRIGVRQLYDLAGIRTPAIARPRRGYVDGGLVTATTAQGGHITGVLHVEVDEGVILRGAAAYIESPAGQKQQLRVVRRNKGAVSGILGSG